MTEKLLWNKRECEIVGYNATGTVLIQMSDTTALLDVERDEVVIVKEEGEAK